jgi:hypothetical protein
MMSPRPLELCSARGPAGSGEIGVGTAQVALTTGMLIEALQRSVK